MGKSVTFFTNMTGSIKKNPYVFISYLILVFIHILLAQEQVYPIISEDEFCYLGYARYFADAGTMPHFATGSNPGSFGYSLILVPVFWLFGSPSGIYQTCLIINAILSSTLIFWTYFLFFNFFKTSRRVALIFSWMISFYPAFMIYTNYCWTDAIMATLIALMFYRLAILLKKPGPLNASLFALISVYIFSVHARGLTALLLALLVLIIMVYQKKLHYISGVVIIGFTLILTYIILLTGSELAFLMTGSENINLRFITVMRDKWFAVLLFSAVIVSVMTFGRKYLFCELLALLSYFLAFFIIDNDHISFAIFFIITLLIMFRSFFISKKIALTDKYELIFFSVVLIISIVLLWVLPGLNNATGSIRAMLFNSFGKLFYTSASTFLIFTFGFITAIYILFSKYDLEFKKIIKSDHAQFLFYSLVLMLGTLFVINSSNFIELDGFRFDRFFYGRYIETSIVPVLCIGLFYINKLRSRDVFLFTLISTIFSFILLIIIIELYGNVLIGRSVYYNMISFFPYFVIFKELNLLLIITVSIAVNVVFIILWKKRNITASLVIIVPFIIIVLFTNIYMTNYTAAITKQKNKIASYIKNLDLCDTLYCDMRLERSHNQVRLQYLLPELRVEYHHLRWDFKGGFILSYKDFLKHNENAVLLLNEHQSKECLWFVPGEDNEIIDLALDHSFLNISSDGFYGIRKVKDTIDNQIQHKYSFDFSDKNEQDSLFIELFKDDDEKVSVYFESINLFPDTLPSGENRKSFNVQEIFQRFYDHENKNMAKLMEFVEKKKRSIVLKPGFKISKGMNYSITYKTITNTRISKNYNNLTVSFNSEKEDTLQHDSKIKNISFSGNVDQKYCSSQFENPVYPELQIFPDHHISATDYSIQDTLYIPYIFLEDSTNEIDRKKHFLHYQWLEYKLKRPVAEGKFLLQDIQIEQRKDILVANIPAPDVAGRHFLIFEIEDEQGDMVPSFSRFIDLIISE